MQEVCRIDDCVNHMSHEVQQQLGLMLGFAQALDIMIILPFC